MVRHVLAVLHDGRTGLVTLPGEPGEHADLERAAGVPLVPAGPALRGAGVVLHRCRGRWAGVAGHAQAPPDDALDALVEVAVGEEDGTLVVPGTRAPWYRGGWYEDTLGWVDGVLAGAGRERTGPGEVVRSWALSHVVRVPTRTGPVWLKACAAHFAVEPAVTAWLSRRQQDGVPHVLGADPDRGLLLMAPLPAGEATPEDLPGVGALTARLHLASVPHRDELLGLGVPARSLAATAGRFAEVVEDGIEAELVDVAVRSRLRSALPWVADRCAELASHGLPETLCHGDLHLGNVARAPHGCVLYDWSDACWSHPLLDVVHLPTVGSGRAALDGWQAGYLDVWRSGWSDAGLRGAVEVAVVVDRVFQAVTYEDLQRALEPAARVSLHGVQARILTRVAELAEGIS